ncbi:3-hydroxyacyl-CoA dehydrogenase NAD-binding domain-containing protein [Methylobacterium sp. J-068]|uniref:3-hydroxyacyl-CoA dehydrogenase NAD-binding domain-containing protein n=1 Tax=Methylobacterium sp. J-068 TaxID=2836649 RepID=UPI001FBB0BCE|nr:3-hydroxyacyl-CoA dehydrogenase NAD-binding domain-containing protein [Methylobacterium sp. J-068]MCJ2035663.1 3-hydroxyacyl-CoA dehydrogenase NAD-binding domain-containing protein [Methylobacterium sp. J-068]
MADTERDEIARVAVLGCGTLGASWAALFLAHGLDVAAYDPTPGFAERTAGAIAEARAQLAELGLRGQGMLRFHDRLAAALAGADFVQENAPENEAVKRALLAEVDGLLPPAILVASSTSAMLRSAIVADCARPERVLVAHPFHPPHLVPLVEIVAATPEVASRAASFYGRLGRRPVILNREMPGHIANRLASALYREAVNLVAEGVASVADIDAALCNGPGLRWAAMGPHMTYHLGGGEGGIRHYLDHLGPSQVRRWASLGAPDLTEDVKDRIVAGIAAEAGGRSVQALAARRDAALIAILGARIEVAGEAE